ncbi:MAG TPA: hypothetical protein VED87_09130 [Methylocystis sp.]|nr:hypothetical protein [Methylocystis sp.]
MRSLHLEAAGRSIGVGESAFEPLERREGVVVTLGPYTHIFDRPGRSVCKWTGTKTMPRQSPHASRVRSWLWNELAIAARILFGGGDVAVNMIVAAGEQREILLTAGDRNVVEKIDLAKLAREGAPSLLFLQTAYLCSSDNVGFKSVPCNASHMSWSRAPYVYKTQRVVDGSRAAILCLSGRTNVWRERIAPGQSRDFALGNIIAVTSNISSKLRPSNQYHNQEAPVVSLRGASFDDEPPSATALSKAELKRRLREVRASLKTLFESIRAREGFFVCEAANHSDRPAYVYVQLNKSSFYGGTGLVGVAIRIVAALFRSSNFLLGH